MATLAGAVDSPIVGRYVFYNDSGFDTVSDDNAIATDKTALLAGETATYDNITNFSEGINGIIIDADLTNPSAFSVNDLELSVGAGSQQSDYSLLGVDAEVTVRIGEGVGGSDRITIILPNGSVTNEFLQVRVLANSTTGLSADDVFYFGNAIGDTGNSSTNLRVDASDLGGVQANLTAFTFADVDDQYDINRDRRVDASDLGLIQANLTAFTSVPLITAPEAVIPVVVVPPVPAPPAPAPAPVTPVAPVVTGTEFFVSTEAEIQSAVNQAQPGDTIILRNGTYTDFDIEFYTDGTPEAPVTFRAETPGEVILTGTSKLFISGDSLIVDGLSFIGGALDRNDSVVEFRQRNNSGLATNSRFTNSQIIDYNPANENTRYHWVRLYGQNNRVDNNTFSGQNHSGVTVVVIRDTSNPDFHRIDNNHFLDRPEGSSNGFESIRLGESDQSLSDSFTIVENNLFEAADGEIEIISVKSGSNIIRNNTFLESAGTLTLRHGNNNLVEGNYFIGNGKNRSGGVRIIGEGHTVVNNYFEGIDGRAGGAISIAAGGIDPPLNGHAQVRDVLVANNTIVNLTDGAAVHFSDGLGNNNGAGPRTLLGVNVTFANNLISTSGETLFQGNQGQNFQFVSNIATGSNLGISSQGFTNVNPQLSRGADGLLRLTSSSPAIDAAFAGLNATDGIDIDGQPRGATFDIGADEFSTVAFTDGPLSGDDVGHDFSGDFSVADTQIAVSPFADLIAEANAGPAAELFLASDSDAINGTIVDDGLIIQSDQFTAALDPNGDGDSFQVVSRSDAFGGLAVLAPSGSRVDVDAGDTQDAVLVYNLEFAEAGEYTAYYRSRGFSSSSDSFFTPSDFGDSNPSVQENVGADGNFRYDRGDTFNVSTDEINTLLEFSIGRRESGFELDAIVFHLDSNLSDTELDALFV